MAAIRPILTRPNTRKPVAKAKGFIQFPPCANACGFAHPTPQAHNARMARQQPSETSDSSSHSATDPVIGRK